MPHHHRRFTHDSYSSSSSDSNTEQRTESKAIETSQSSSDEETTHTTHTAQISSSQTNVGMFQTVQQPQRNQIEQNKEKTSCCDCLLSFFIKP